ncbi:probable indole-3-pyruvate monooxygenase YUCCA10 [Elaeis guineensis]|uniref:Flavin-containing monooxygenase n=1 Tax=Elaeis guineensis var. tenera TaxID=51953 RepID=A0A6I9QJ90_ELAGV|nr:probable indole-3-pyruvate monooxygenase YUCCA10 [Elaeis guineensis]
MRKQVVIVGAGPSGLATAACLNSLCIPNIMLEKEDCAASLWKKRTYDRLKLHLAKQFCALPHFPFPKSTATFVPKNDFIRYVDNYVAYFNLMPIYHTTVESASFDERSKTWSIEARNGVTGKVDVYTAMFLVIASGENSEGFIPDIPGLESFPGEVIHSSYYKSGKLYNDEKVLVVGSGNSGMEIAFDLSNYGAQTSITIRSPLNVMPKEYIRLGMVLAKYLPIRFVDCLLLMLSKLKFGDLSNYGIVTPNMGPLADKAATGRSAVIDVGTIAKIKSGEIQVVKEPLRITGNEVAFSDGKSYHFDAIIFATGYKSITNTWLKDYDFILNKDGFPKQQFPNHWKGKNGLYCVGLARRGLQGVSMDAQNIANDIAEIVNGSNGAP